jgi:hypothetical protein
LDIKEDEVRVVFLDEVDGLESVLALGDDIHVVGIFQEKSEFVAGQLLIVDDHCG